MDRRSWKSSSLALAIIAGILAPTSAPAHPAPAPEQLRVLSFNVAGINIPFANDNADFFGGMDISDRGIRIAEFIKAGNYDIVAIEEAWVNPPLADTISDDIYNNLVIPAGPYPFAVKGLASQSSVKLDSSGLMLFSKLPFLAVPTPAGQSCYTGLPAQCLVAFHEYAAATGEDAVTAKGVGFVRVKSPASGMDLNVFWTHMQASDVQICVGTCDWVATRASQTQELIRFVNAWAPLGDPRRETLVMGDFNVPFKRPNGTLTAEYNARMADFASIGLRDEWLDTSPADRMDSFIADDPEKLDYMLFRPAPASPTALPSSCFEHQTLERQFHIEAQGDQTYSGPASDHYGYASVIGAFAARCSPATADIDPANGVYQLSIPHPSAFQWFHFTKPGTYGFDVVNTPEPFELTAYADDDLSTPMTPLEGSSLIPANGRRGEPDRVVFSTPKPLFLRVRAVNPLSTGAYSLVIHHHNGSSYGDYIHLDPFDPFHAVEMNDQQVQNPLITEYFQFRTHSLRSLKKQALSFITTLHPNLNLRMRIFDKSKIDGGLPNPLIADTLNYNGPAFTWSFPVSTSPVPAAGADYYLTVERLTNINMPGPFGDFDIEWRSNLFLADVVRLKVIEDDDFSAHDEPEAAITVDSTPVINVVLGEIAEGKGNDFPSFASGLAADTSVSIFVRENDDDTGDLCFEPGADCTSFGTNTITVGDVTLDPSKKTFDYFSSVDPDNGHYRVSFRAWRRIRN